MRISQSIMHAIIGCTLAGAATLASAEVVVVVAANSPVTSITASQAADIFLGKAKELPGGGAAVPVDLQEGSSERDEFYTSVAGKSAAQMKAYWSKIIFSGKGQPPEEVADSASVKKLVAGNPNAIGYIDKAAVDGTVKAVLGN